MSRRLFVTLTALAFLSSGFIFAPSIQASPGTECTGTAEMTMTPGISEKGTSGTQFARNGTEKCNGPLNGSRPTGDPTVEWEGRYGTKDPDTCSSGGEGWAVSYHTLPTENGTKVVRNIFTFTFGGLSDGIVSGVFKGDYFSGTFEFRPLEGDCVTRPLTKAALTFKGTWHEYRANS